MSRKSKRATLPKKQTMRLHLKCPNCLTPTISYKVEWRSALLTELTQECKNPLCRMEYVSYVEADRILHTPKIIINPELGRDMKLSKLARSRRLEETIGQMETSSNTDDLKLMEDAMPPQGDLFYSQENDDDSS